MCKFELARPKEKKIPTRIHGIGEFPITSKIFQTLFGYSQLTE